MRKSSAAPPMYQNLRFGSCGFSGSGAGAGVAAAGVDCAAETCTGGGGQRVSSPWVTVMPRTTVSSMSRTGWPSLSGVTSLSRLTMLVP